MIFNSCKYKFSQIIEKQTHFISLVDLLENIGKLVMETKVLFSVCHDLRRLFGVSESERIRYITNADRAVAFHPCKMSMAHSVPVLRHKSAYQTCLFPHPMLATTERQEFRFALLVHISFHLNISFLEFLYSSLLWYEADFLYIQPAKFSSKKSAEHLFCGKRHPWTLIHTSNIATVWTVAKFSSTFKLQHQITDSQTMKSFHLCPNEVCARDSICGGHNEYKNKAILQTFVLFDKHPFKCSIYHLKVHKYQLLLLKSEHDILVFDGPTTESAERQFEISADPQILLSSFQATIVLAVLSLQKEILSFFGKDKITTVKSNFERNTTFDVVFGKHCPDNNFIMFDTLWLKQPEKLSFNLSVDYVQYFGPEDPANPDIFGGIAVVDKQVKQFESYELLSLSFMYDKSSDFKQHIIVTEVSTEYLIVVCYYYSQYSLVKAKLSVSLTSCSGRYFPMQATCSRKSYHIIDEPKPFFSFISRSGEYAILREGSQCVILVFKTKVNTAKQVSLFEMTPKYGSGCVKGSLITNHIVLGTALNDLKELQIETHMIPYIIALQSSMVLYKSMFNDTSSFSSRTEKFRLSNYKKNNPLVQDRSSCDVPFEPTSKSPFWKMFIVSNDNRTNHDIMTSAGYHSSVNFYLYSKKPAVYLWHSWMTVFIQKLTCQSIFYPATRLPPDVLWPAWVHLCANAWRKSHLERNTFANKTNICVSSYKTLLLEEEFFSLESKFGSGISSAYMQVNLTENDQNGTLKIQLNEKVPNLQFVLPAFYVEIVIPTFDYILCSLRSTEDDSFPMQCLFEVLISKPLLPHIETIHVVQKGLNRNKAVMKPHLVLTNLCENLTTEYFYQFVSWMEAQDECRSRGLYLPSVHSTKDMQILKEQIEMYQCNVSQHYQRNPHKGLQFSFLYEVIGIYVGLVWEVKYFLVLFYLYW